MFLVSFPVGERAESLLATKYCNVCGTLAPGCEPAGGDKEVSGLASLLLV